MAKGQFTSSSVIMDDKVKLTTHSTYKTIAGLAYIFREDLNKL